MSIVKGLILIVFFIMLYKINLLKKENIEQKDFFIRTLSHDFRVATIAQLRGLEILNKISQFDSRQMELLTEINNSCLYSLDMISMLQNTYDFEYGKQFLKLDFFRLQNVFDNVLKKTNQSLQEKNISLRFENISYQNIIGDESMVHKLILLLLLTAIDYSEANSIILMSSNLENEKWKFSLTYSGKTLTDEEIGRMFSLKTYYSTVGHGIKMHLCKKIVDFHKGRIYVKKVSKNINSFTFEIPQKEKREIWKSPLIADIQLGS